jgi:hypothetical protein
MAGSPIAHCSAPFVEMPEPAQNLTQRSATRARRWRELVAKEALGTITADEQAKLERYQMLLRHKPSADERRHEACMRYDTKRMMKLTRRLLHEATNSPTDELR